jgi:hypothetical protein
VIDVFLRWYPQGVVRKCIARTVSVRLNLMREIDLHFLEADVGEPYHVCSKKRAEVEATSPIYCVIDDDQLPIGDDFFARGVEALENNPEYGMLAGFPLEYGLHGQPYAHRTEDVIEAHSIGCPYFVRKGTLKGFPDGPLRQYDGILSKVVTDQGLKTGFARKCLYNHLGYGFSQVEQAP